MVLIFLVALIVFTITSFESHEVKLPQWPRFHPTSIHWNNVEVW